MGIVYISRSCDFPKKENLMDYISIFGRHFLKNYQKRKFDGLSRLHDSLKSENGEQVGVLT